MGKNKIWEFIFWNPKLTWKQWTIYLGIVIVAWAIGRNLTKKPLIGIIIAEVIAVTLLFLCWFKKR